MEHKRVLFNVQRLMELTLSGYLLERCSMDFVAQQPVALVLAAGQQMVVYIFCIK